MEDVRDIRLIRLVVRHFKGIDGLDLVFGTDGSVIRGRNGCGKTSVFDAFCWLLWGKDSAGDARFEVKPLGGGNEVLWGMEPDVLGELSVNGVVVCFRRVLKEDWVRRRGSEDSEFKGNTTLFFVNDVPMKAGEYGARVNGMFGEDLFRLVTHPFYFAGMDWRDRRAILVKLAGDVDDVLVARGNSEFEDLLVLLSGKSFGDAKLEFAFKKKGLKREMDQVPIRISEVKRDLVGLDGLGLEVDLRAEIGALDGRLLALDAGIADGSVANVALLEAKNGLIGKVYGLKADGQRLLFDLEQRFLSGKAVSEEARLLGRLGEIKEELERKDKRLVAGAAELAVNIGEVTRLRVLVNELREEFRAVADSRFVFDAGVCVCPTCLRGLELVDVVAKEAELLGNFEMERDRMLRAIQARGEALKGEIVAKEAANVALDGMLAGLRVGIHKLERERDGVLADLGAFEASDLVMPDFKLDAGFVKLCGDIEVLEAEIAAMGCGVVVDDLVGERKLVVAELAGKRRDLDRVLLMDGKRARVLELELEERAYGVQLANLERVEFVMMEFAKAKMDLVSRTVNGMFGLVQFKLFAGQINGGETECCETLINGVPWGDANTASRVNAGLDIINVLGGVYGVKAPIFIDNRESVSDVIATDGQVISLVVDKDCDLVVKDSFATKANKAHEVAQRCLIGRKGGCDV